MYEQLIATLPVMDVLRIVIGMHWTAVVVEVEGEKHCGLASTLWDRGEHHGIPDVPQAGELNVFSALELAAMVTSNQLTMRSVGMVTINALLPKHPEAWSEENTEEVIARYGADKLVVLVGHFPFIPRLRNCVGELVVLERHQQLDDLPETAAKDVIPAASIVAITGMSLLNHSLENLLELCSSQTRVILLGPSTQLSPVMFEYGIDLLCGSIVTNIDTVLKSIEQGANVQQIHKAGVSLVNMVHPGLETEKEH